MSKLNLVIIGTYNEVENIGILINRIFKHIDDCSILVIDDNSPDGTANAIKELMQKFPNLELIERERKLGLGSAYRLGFEWGLKREFQNIIHMDADLSHRVRDLSKMLAKKEEDSSVGLVIGSRWTNGGSTQNWPIKRQALSRFANKYVRFMLGVSTHDSTAGFRLYDRTSLVALNLNSVVSEGYAFHIELTRALTMLGIKIVEVPIVFRERAAGVSKMSSKVVKEAMSLVTIWGIKRFLHLK
jgi:dolichol-phosphate mannosyltransferase